MYRASISAVRICVLAIPAIAGCVAPATPVPTLWQRLGIPQAGVSLRDSTLNRSGNFPGLEKKPPLLKLADPANLAPEKPKMVQAAAKIKAEQDMKKQKIKALKFLAEVNCGCYNKDKSVEKAFLEALADCDPDVRTAAIEGLKKAAGDCKCKTGCETTCCTEDIYKKLNDVAYGMEDGCYKEPVQEIRCAAAMLIKQCGCPKANPIEELPLPPADVTEELAIPDAETPPQKPQEGEGTIPPPKRPDEGEAEGSLSDMDEEDKTTSTMRSSRGFHLSDNDENTSEEGNSVSPKVVVASTAQMMKLASLRSNKVQSEKQTTSISKQITNPERLITARVVEFRKNLGEVLIDLPSTYDLNVGWTMVVVDHAGNQSLAQVADCGGKRLLLSLDDFTQVTFDRTKAVRVGLISK